MRYTRALPHGAVAAALAAVRASSARPVVKLVFEILVLTAAGSADAHGARWDEMDSEGQAWTIPGPRMKAHREQRVPLCARALLFALLTAEEAHGLAQASIKNGQTWTRPAADLSTILSSFEFKVPISIARLEARYNIRSGITNGIRARRQKWSSRNH